MRYRRESSYRPQDKVRWTPWLALPRTKKKSNLIESRLGCRQLSRLCVEVLAKGLLHAVDVRSM